jgi:hypothetical protein
MTNLVTKLHSNLITNLKNQSSSKKFPQLLEVANGKKKLNFYFNNDHNRDDLIQANELIIIYNH